MAPPPRASAPQASVPPRPPPQRSRISAPPTAAPTWQAPPTASRWWVRGGIAAGVCLAAAAAFAFVPRSSTLVITVADDHGRPVSGLSITVDGVERCTSSPCRISGLERGPHLVGTLAAGYGGGAPRAVITESGEDAVHAVTLSHNARTGLRVVLDDPALSVQVDGFDKGPPPVTLDELTPGTHHVRIYDARMAYAPYDTQVEVSEGSIATLEPKPLEVVRGRLRLEPGDGASGASVSVDGKVLSTLPVELELDGRRPHQVSAQREGYAPMVRTLRFEAGQANLRVQVDLSALDGAPLGAFASYSSAGPRSRGGAATRRSVATFAPLTNATSASTSPMDTAAASAAGGTSESGPSAGAGAAPGVLDISSSPGVAVVVDGVPRGVAPVSVSVPPGRHTIVFIHPEQGRKVASITVDAGEHRRASLPF